MEIFSRPYLFYLALCSGVSAKAENVYSSPVGRISFGWLTEIKYRKIDERARAVVFGDLIVSTNVNALYWLSRIFIVMIVSLL